MNLEHTSKVATQHEIKHKEAIIVVLECITEVDQEGVVHLHFGGEALNRAQEGLLTSSRTRLSWMVLATAFCLMHCCLSMYLSA